MKTCSLNEFMEELKPWLDKAYIKKAFVNEDGRFVLIFLDGMKNVYHIDDCNRNQIEKVLKDLAARGVPTE